jgi:hypothetical protein
MSKTEKLHEAYAKQNYECMMRGDIDGMMYWAKQIDELLQSSKPKVNKE